MDKLIERCASMYFKVVTLFDGGLAEEQKKTIINRLATIYMVSTREIDVLYNAWENDAVREISDDEQYKQFKRVMQFAISNGYDIPFCDEQIAIIDIKGHAIYDVADAELLNRDRSATCAECFNRIMQSSEGGNVTAMFIVALMQMEGIIVGKDIEMGMKTIQKLSKWVDADGQLLALHYDTDNKDLYLSRLYTVTKGLADAGIYIKAKNFYAGTKDEINPELNLILKAVSKKIVKRDTYNAHCERFAYSKVLSFKDIQRFIMSENKEMLANAGTLPLKMATKKQSVAFARPIKTIFDRTEEQTKIAKMLGDKGFVPTSKICLCTDDNYVQECYVNAIKDSVRDCNVRYFQLEMLSEDDLCNTLGNVFLRSISENKYNLFMISIRGNNDKDKLQKVYDFMEDEKRKHFKVAPLNVDIDLSAITIVVFCDIKMQKDLRKHCMTIVLNAVTDDERLKVLKRLLCDAQSRYGISDVVFEDEAIEKLKTLKLQNAVEVIERSMQTLCLNEKTILTQKHIEESNAELFGQTVNYGFGGKYICCNN